MSNVNNRGKKRIRNLFNHINLVHAYVREHGFDVFEELAQKDPQRAVQEFPKFLDSVLSAGNDFFRGYMCGGPHEGATAPLLNIIGSIYPKLKREQRAIALQRCLNFLDGLNYSNSQNNTELIHEPWLVGDIVINRALYWCGFSNYIERLKKVKTYEDFEKEFRFPDNYKSSIFWLLYSISRTDCGYDLPVVRAGVFSLAGDLEGRTKDAIAALVYDHSKLDEENPERKIPFEEGVERRLKNYGEEMHMEIRERIKEQNWIYLPQTLKERAIFLKMKQEEIK